MITRFAAAMVATLVVSASASAQVTPYAGFTNGCFGLGCVPATTSALNQAVFQKLTFQNSTFSGTTAANGTASLNAAATPLGTQNSNNLGSFTINAKALAYSTPFTLAVTFTVPGNGNLFYSAMITGQYVQAPAPNGGVVTVDFDNTPQSFAFGSGSTLSLTVNDITMPRPVGAVDDLDFAITGNIAVATPEPASMALLGTGLLGIGGLVSRRRRTRA